MTESPSKATDTSSEKQLASSHYPMTCAVGSTCKESLIRQLILTLVPRRSSVTCVLTLAPSQLAFLCEDGPDPSGYHYKTSGRQKRPIRDPLLKSAPRHTIKYHPHIQLTLQSFCHKKVGMFFFLQIVG